MKHFEYKHKRFTVQAKRKNEKKWTEWTIVDDYESASKHAKRVEEIGYDAKIIDKGERRCEPS